MERYNSDQREAIVEFCRRARLTGVVMPQVNRLLLAAQQDSPVLSDHLDLLTKSGGRIYMGLDEEEQRGVRELLTKLYADLARFADRTEEEQRRSTRFEMRLTPEEREMVNKIIDRTGESASDMVRRLVKQAHYVEVLTNQDPNRQS